MLKYVVRRILEAIPALLGVTVLVFLVVRVLPGDPILAMMGREGDPTVIAHLRHLYGLDRPLSVQYIEWLGNVLRGDFGLSLRYREPVAGLVLERLPATLQLIIGSMIVSSCIAIPVGVITASKPGSLRDNIGSALSLFGLSVPAFWLAILLILAFGYYIKILPPFGYADPLKSPIEFLGHLALPALAQGLILAGTVTKMVRTSMLDALRLDCIKFARLKGLAERVIIYKHALRNAMIPVVTIMGLQFGYLLGGTVVIESIFTWPGMGQLLLWSVYLRDYWVIQAAILLYAVLFYAVNLLMDILYAYLDPRIRFQ